VLYSLGVDVDTTAPVAVPSRRRNEGIYRAQGKAVNEPYAIIVAHGTLAIPK